MNKLTRTAGIFAAPLLLALLLSLIYLVPNNAQLQESAISPNLPEGAANAKPWRPIPDSAKPSTAAARAGMRRTPSS